MRKVDLQVFTYVLVLSETHLFEKFELPLRCAIFSQ